MCSIGVIACLFILTGSAYASDAMMGQTDETNGTGDYSSGLISIPQINTSQSQPIIGNFTPNENATVPEFGPLSCLIFVFSIISVLVISTCSGIRDRI